MFTSSVDSTIHSFSSSFSSAQLISTCQDDIPSVYMTLPSICDSFPSLALTFIYYRMNTIPVSVDIPLNQMQSDLLVSVH